MADENLFIAPSESGRTEAVQSFAKGGYNVLHWARDGFEFWAVSEVSGGDLRAADATNCASVARSCASSVASGFLEPRENIKHDPVGASYFAKEHGLPQRGSDEVLAELREGEE